jgi:YD repeat-containing protein
MSFQAGTLRIALREARADSIQYAYDALGRLVQATDTTSGQAIFYTYDAAGNMTSQSVVGTSTLDISSFSPVAGTGGTTVVINGTGFSTTPASDTVKFNGTAATVSAATQTQLTVTAPSGGTTGTVSVTVGTGTVTSSSPFTYLAAGHSNGPPTITGFTPAGGPGGTVVTISGTNFQASTLDDEVLINNSPATVTAATAGSLTVTVPTDVSSGPIQVTTPYGTATSATNFVVVPPGYTEVVGTTQTTENGGTSSQSASVVNQPVLFLFSGNTGDNIKVAVTTGTAAVEVIDPQGVIVASGTSPVALYVQSLGVTGTYTVSYAPTTAGTASVTITTPKIAGANLSWSNEDYGYPNQVYTVLGGAATQPVYLTFTGAVGQLTQVVVANVSGTWTLSLMNSLGRTLWTSASFSSSTTVSIPALPADGNYTLVFDSGVTGGNAQYEAGIVASGSLSVGSVLTVSGGGPGNIDGGPVAKVTFSGTAGQDVTMLIGATRGFYYDLNMYYPSGTSRACLGTCGGGSGGSDGFSFGPLPYTGTYTIYLQYGSNPYFSTTNLELQNSVPLTINAAATQETTLSDGATFTTITFSATGQSLTFHDNCNPGWILVNSSGTIVNNYWYDGIPPTGSWSLGTLNGTYTLITNLDDSNFVPPLIGTTAASVYSAQWSSNWPGTETCSLQLTSP